MYSSIILFILSCNNKNNYIHIDVLDFSEKSLIEGFNYSKLVDTIEYIQLETTNNSLIGQIDKVILSKDFIFILDSYSTGSIYKFSRNGEFIQLISRNGKGPGEYIVPIDITITKNSLYILDGSSKKVIQFDLQNCEFIEENRLDFFANKIMAMNNQFVFVEGQRGKKAVITDKEFNVINKQFDFNFINAKDYPLPFHVMNDTILYRMYLNDTLYFLDNQEFKPKYIINLGKKQFNTKNYKSLESEKRFVSNDDVFDFEANLKYFGETSSHIYFTYTYQNIFNIILYDKKSKKHQAFSYNSVENDITFEKYAPLIIGSTHNSFIGYIENPKLISEENLSTFELRFNNAFLKYQNDNFSVKNPILFLITFENIQ